jgi:hypothetical protein
MAGNEGMGMIDERTGPAHGPLCAAIATEIRDMRALIDGLATLLAADARFAMEYLEQFQLFDLLAQRADESAAVLDRIAAGQSAAEAVAPVRLTAVQTRLSAALAEN